MNHENYIELSWKEASRAKMEFHEHIYENVTNRYKEKIFNGIINSFTSKARDLSLLNQRNKHILNQSSMNSQHDNEYDECDSSSSHQFENYECDDGSFLNSYTSCVEDNIYENLEFFDNEIYKNDSLSDWMRHLVHDTADYEMDNLMFVKSIPSVFNVRQSKATTRRVNRSEITLNFLKILWNRDDNVDTISLLLQTFSTLLRDQNKPLSVSSLSSSESIATNKTAIEKSSLKKHRKSLKKTIDNRIYQRFEYVILSVSLSTLVITYNKSQKFYFALVYSEVFVKLPSNVKVRGLIKAVKTKFVFDFVSRSETCEFYKILRKLLKSKLKEIKVAETLESYQNFADFNESIYQQIWTCQTISDDDDNNKGTIINSENIYASLEQVHASDDHEWEIDDEFSFMNPKFGVYSNCETMIDQNNDDNHKTVWVLYSEENPELNKFFYDSSHLNILSNSRDNQSEKIIDVDSEQPFSVISHDIPEKYFESVKAWKLLLKDPFYMEDEEDIIINDSMMNENFASIYDTEDDRSYKSANASSSFSLPLDETSSVKSSYESYKSISEDALDMPEEKIESPKKEREKFRDKVRSRLKMKSSRASNDISSDSPLAKNDDDGDKHIVFGCNLEKVEKDAEQKDIPKIIIECVRALELQHNIMVPGIYRISGNKVTIDAIKKKLNDKKQSKKYASLSEKDLDVHALTGILKMFFRELTTPLMPKQIFIQCTSEQLSPSQMREILTQMPRVNYETLKHLFRHFKTVEKYQNENLMTSGNLAICLGLCLFSNNFETMNKPNPFDHDISKCNMLCKYLIDHYYEVFEDNLK